MNKQLETLALTLASLGLTATLTACSGGDDDAGDVTDTPQAGDDDTNSQADPCDGVTGCSYDGDLNLATLQGEITRDLTLYADVQYLLKGGVFIGNDVDRTVLTIEPGTTIYGDASTVSVLTIRRGSQIMAEGRVDAPIVFTSALEEPSTGSWGGLVINGRAPINICDTPDQLCEAEGEGSTGTYGGIDANDNSGVLKYVVVAYAGTKITDENELNGIALQGVGAGTTLDYVQVHRNADDGIELFGGTVNVRHVLITGADDDSLDWTMGWTGMAQFVILQQYDGVGDNGIEADNYGDNHAAEPRAEPTISNLTVIGSPSSDKSDIGLLLRAGTAGHISNAIVMDFNEACLDIDDGETFTNASDGEGGLSGELTLENSLLFCTTSFVEDDTDMPFTVQDFYTLNGGNSLQDPMLRDPHGATPDFRPASSSPAESGAVVPSDTFFTQVSFRGAVDPDEDWTAGWTLSD